MKSSSCSISHVVMIPDTDLSDLSYYFDWLKQRTSLSSETPRVTHKKHKSSSHFYTGRHFSFTCFLGDFMVPPVSSESYVEL